MNTQTGINYFYDFLGLDTANFKIFYDFSTANTTSTSVLSVANASSLHSGTASTVSVLNNSGKFNGSAQNKIKIWNTTQDVFPDDVTLICKFRSDATSGDVRSALFSSLTGETFKSGYNFGINSANHLFFEYWDDTGPVTLVSTRQLAETNIATLNVSNNNVGIGWYNCNNRQLETENFSIDSQYLLYSDQWRLGGDNLGEHPNFSGYYGAFLGFNTSLSKNVTTRLISGLYSYTGITLAVSGTLISTDIIGYSTSVMASDVTGFSYSLSGYQSVGSCGPSYPIYNIVQQSGSPVSGSGYYPIYGPKTGYYLISPEKTTVIIDSPSLLELGYDSIKYTWKDVNSSGIEFYNKTGLDSVNYLNKYGVYDSVIGDFSSDSFYPSGDCNVFLNGVGQIESGYNTIGQFYNVTKVGITDYYIDNQYFNFKEDISTSDILIYDNNQLQNRAIIDYSGSATVTVGIPTPANNYNIFANGQKLISGRDYTQSNNIFSIASDIRSAISGGKMLFVSGDINLVRYTGLDSFIRGGKFLPDTTVSYLNGVRNPDGFTIEHSHLSPISGKYIYPEGLDLITNGDLDDYNSISGVYFFANPSGDSYYTPGFFSAYSTFFML